MDLDSWDGSVHSLSESDIQEAFQRHAGSIQRRTLLECRRPMSNQQEASETAPRKRRFYAMTTDAEGNEKALDGIWVDHMQELLDEAARAYGAKNEFQDETRRQEQNELKGEIRERFTNFFTSGSESIDCVLAELLPVWRCLSAERGDGLDVSDLGDFQTWLQTALTALKEAREKGCAHAQKVSRQWFAFLSKEVYNVEKVGEDEVKDLQHLKRRLKLLHTHEELNQRWGRMDALNAGLEEAVHSKASLENAVQTAEALLVKQVEAEYHKAFQRETKAMLLEAARSRADTMSQEETCARLRLNLRAELMRVLTELHDKVKQWHPKVCRKYSDSIHSMKASKKRAEEKLRAIDHKLSNLRQKISGLKSSLETMLKPYLPVMDLNLEKMPNRDDLATRIYDAVALSEEPLISPTLQDSVLNLIYRSPWEKMNHFVSSSPHQDQAWDVETVTQQLQKTQTAQSDLQPFLTTEKWPKLLLRPEGRLLEILGEFRELLERSSFTKLLQRLEVLKTLTGRGEDFVGAEAAAIMALSILSALARLQRGCKLWAMILSLRCLELRKQALKRALAMEEPLRVHAALRAAAGGLGQLQPRAAEVLRRAEKLLKTYGDDLEDIIEVTTRRRWSPNSERRERLDPREAFRFQHLPAVLLQRGNGEAAVTLRYQHCLLKLQLAARRWLRLSVQRPLSTSEFQDTEEALAHMEKWLRKRLPWYEETPEPSEVPEEVPSPSGPLGTSSPGSPGSPTSSPRTWERARSSSGIGWQAQDVEPELEEPKEQELEPSPARGRSSSEILHDRPVKTQLLEDLQRRFEELLPKAESSRSSSEEEASLPEPDTREIRSRATFLNWSQPARRSTEAHLKRVVRGLILAKTRRSSVRKETARVFTDLSGRERTVQLTASAETPEVRPRMRRSRPVSPRPGDPEDLVVRPEEKRRSLVPDFPAAPAVAAVAAGAAGAVAGAGGFAGALALGSSLGALAQEAASEGSPSSQRSPPWRSRDASPAPAVPALSPTAWDVLGLQGVRMAQPTPTQLTPTQPTRVATVTGEEETWEDFHYEDRESSEESVLMVEDTLPELPKNVPSHQAPELPKVQRVLEPERRPERHSPSPVAKSEASPLAETSQATHLELMEQLNEPIEPLPKRVPKMPQRGRAFPSSSRSTEISGPPMTARRMTLHQRPGVQVSEHVAEPESEEEPEWGLPLPHPPGSAWRLLHAPEETAKEQEVDAEKGDEEIEEDQGQEEEEEEQKKVVVRIRTHSFDERMARIAPRGRLHSGPPWLPTPQESRSVSEAGSVDREEDPEDGEDEDGEAGEDEDESGDEEFRGTGEVGPIRRGLPMTRRGVAHLLSQHPVESTDLNLQGESVPSRYPRRLIRDRAPLPMLPPLPRVEEVLSVQEGSQEVSPFRTHDTPRRNVTLTPTSLEELDEDFVRHELSFRTYVPESTSSFTAEAKVRRRRSSEVPEPQVPSRPQTAPTRATRMPRARGRTLTELLGSVRMSVVEQPEWTWQMRPKSARWRH